MIIKNNTNPEIEKIKIKLGLTGDVYLYKEHFIESLESHKNLVENSTAQTIEEAYNERIHWEIEQDRIQKELAERYAQEHPDELNMEE